MFFSAYLKPITVRIPGMIKLVVKHSGQLVYTRNTKADDSAIVE